MEQTDLFNSGGTDILFNCPKRSEGLAEGKEQLVTRAKRGLDCTGH